jgi:hypothetical protein
MPNGEIWRVSEAPAMRAYKGKDGAKQQAASTFVVGFKGAAPISSDILAHNLELVSG